MASTIHGCPTSSYRNSALPHRLDPTQAIVQRFELGAGSPTIGKSESADSRNMDIPCAVAGRPPTYVLTILMRKAMSGPASTIGSLGPQDCPLDQAIDGRNGTNETYIDEVDRMTRVRSEIVPTVKWATLGDQYRTHQY